MSFRFIIITILASGIVLGISGASVHASGYFLPREKADTPPAAPKHAALNPGSFPIEKPASGNYGQPAPLQSYTETLTYTELRSEIGKLLEEAGIGEQVDAVIFDEKRRVFFQNPKGFTYHLDRLSVDRSNQTYEITITLTGKDGATRHDRLSGRYEHYVNVPVITRRLGGEEIITEDMLSWKPIPSAHLRKDTITDMSVLLGKTPKHRLIAQRQIRRRDITLPAIVNEGDLVRIQYRSGNMTLSTVGRALENAAEGQTIRIENIDSQKIIRATVIEKGIAHVAAR